jgi:hypothetical protein
MDDGSFVQVSAMTGWVIGVSHVADHGYRCWLINPDLDVLSDGTVYSTSSAAMSAGRAFVSRHA